MGTLGSISPTAQSLKKGKRGSNGRLASPAEAQTNHTHLTYELWEVKKPLSPRWVPAKLPSQGAQTSGLAKLTANHRKHPGCASSIWVALSHSQALSQAG